jgi:hypothetical protein
MLLIDNPHADIRGRELSHQPQRESGAGSERLRSVDDLPQVET